MSTSEKTYKELQTELNDIIERFEGSVHEDVDAMLVDYEQAEKLIRELEDRLKKATVSLQKIAKNENG